MVTTLKDLLRLLDESRPDSDDIISRLPPEISTTIFRLLDRKSLQIAATVCKQWCRICKADLLLKLRIRKYIRVQRRRTQLHPLRTRGYKGIELRNDGVIKRLITENIKRLKTGVIDTSFETVINDVPEPDCLVNIEKFNKKRKRLDSSGGSIKRIRL